MKPFQKCMEVTKQCRCQVRPLFDGGCTAPCFQTVSRARSVTYSRRAAPRAQIRGEPARARENPTKHRAGANPSTIGRNFHHPASPCPTPAKQANPPPRRSPAYRGDIVLARAAAVANIPMIMSGASLARLEEVRAAGDTAWFQAYLPGETGPITHLLERVARSGFDTLVLTADVPVSANRENNVRSGFSRPLRPTLRLAWECSLRPRWLFGMFLRTLLVDGMPHFENLGARIPLITRASRGDGERDRLAWTHLERMRKLWKGHLVLKGVLAPEDARIARESGVDGVIVSNHGGRQLDGALAPLRALPAVVAQAGGMTVMMDGGIRRGTDVLKALALGAQVVFVGLPFLYAAAIGGEAGVRHGIGLLREEIERDMALLGITTLAEMTQERIRPRAV